MGHACKIVSLVFAANGLQFYAVWLFEKLLLSHLAVVD
jgi:hypothetical protein